MIRYAGVTPRLPVADIRRTVTFYQSLGFKVDVLWPDNDPTFAILNRNDTSIGFFLRDEHRPGAIGYAELYIEVTDAAALHRTIQDRVAVEWGPEVYSYGRREFAIKDPDSYLVIFTEPTDDPPSVDELE